MKYLFTVAALALSMYAFAEPNSQNFPAAATQFIDGEMPAMEKAVAAKDRAYFDGARLRAQAFLNRSGAMTPGNPALEQHPACASAVLDFLIVGLCKISPPGSICEPNTFFPEFERNRSVCREEARH